MGTVVDDDPECFISYFGLTLFGACPDVMSAITVRLLGYQVVEMVFRFGWFIHKHVCSVPETIWIGLQMHK